MERFEDLEYKIYETKVKNWIYLAWRSRVGRKKNL